MRATGREINDEFQKRLTKIASNLILNQTELARFNSQLLVRDYGTHIITSVDIGAALSQVCMS